MGGSLLWIKAPVLLPRWDPPSARTLAAYENLCLHENIAERIMIRAFCVDVFSGMLPVLHNIAIENLIVGSITSEDYILIYSASSGGSDDVYFNHRSLVLASTLQQVGIALCRCNPLSVLVPLQEYILSECKSLKVAYRRPVVLAVVVFLVSLGNTVVVAAVVAAVVGFDSIAVVVAVFAVVVGFDSIAVVVAVAVGCGSILNNNMDLPIIYSEFTSVKDSATLD
ncbi:hypothetical protein M513_00701 [Trichuris suis]|uniref:Uncharacterized protein n=1 Tax=Trichuris suis TaxID=68888 RepID=A0A085MMM9_9BILA|nr:hypothetical protein M513_00701 [Trichuris suis]